MEKRLNKYLAEAGIGARRKVETLIFAGQVAVNGELCLLPQTRVHPGKDKITVCGEKVKLPGKIYLIINKPVGYTCSHKRLGKGALVYDLLPQDSRLFSVGRLDKETSGLLIATNDGDFSQEVIHPSKRIEKEYIVKTNQEITHLHLTTISRGTRVTGVWVKPRSVVKVRKGTLKVVVIDGRKREVRELMQAAGLKVLELKRVRIGGLKLGTLPVGASRELSEQEREQVLKIC